MVDLDTSGFASSVGTGIGVGVGFGALGKRF